MFSRRARASTDARPSTRSAVDAASATAAERARTVTWALTRTGQPVRGSSTWPIYRDRVPRVWPNVAEVEHARSASGNSPTKPPAG